MYRPKRPEPGSSGLHVKAVPTCILPTNTWMRNKPDAEPRLRRRRRPMTTIKKNDTTTRRKKVRRLKCSALNPNGQRTICDSLYLSQRRAIARSHHRRNVSIFTPVIHRVVIGIVYIHRILGNRDDICKFVVFLSHRGWPNGFDT